MTIRIEINQCELKLTSLGQDTHAKIGSNHGKQQ
jgi:hypothetical protein